MKAATIMTDDEWESYCKSFAVAESAHSPRVPPSFPVLAISQEHGMGVSHSFIEAADLRKMLGLDPA